MDHRLPTQQQQQQQQRLQPYELQQRSRYDFSASEIEDMQRTFRQFDTNGDGDIDIMELGQVMKLIHRRQDNDQVDESRLKKMIATVDSDGDGKMSFEEFVALVHRCKKVGRVIV